MSAAGRYAFGSCLRTFHGGYGLFFVENRAQEVTTVVILKTVSKSPEFVK